MRVIFARAALLGTAAAAVLIATPAFAQENSSSNSEQSQTTRQVWLSAAVNF